MLVENPIFRECQHFGCYLAVDGEFDCAPIIEAIWSNQKNCYLPALSSVQERLLEFLIYRRNDPLIANRYQILEPEKNTPAMPNKNLDIIFLPLVGFDLQGHRLGMGSGYYDKTFEFILKNPKEKPRLIGLAFADQQVEELPSDPWDVPISGVLTEKDFLIFRDNGQRGQVLTVDPLA